MEKHINNETETLFILYLDLKTECNIHCDDVLSAVKTQTCQLFSLRQTITQCIDVYMHVFSGLFQRQIVMKESPYRIHKLQTLKCLTEYPLRKFITGTRADLSQAHIKLQILFEDGRFPLKADSQRFFRLLV